MAFTLQHERFVGYLLLQQQYEPTKPPEKLAAGVKYPIQCGVTVIPMSFDDQGRVTLFVGEMKNFDNNISAPQIPGWNGLDFPTADNGIVISFNPTPGEVVEVFGNDGEHDLRSVVVYSDESAEVA